MQLTRTQHIKQPEALIKKCYNILHLPRKKITIFLFGIIWMAVFWIRTGFNTVPESGFSLILS